MFPIINHSLDTTTVKIYPLFHSWGVNEIIWYVDTVVFSNSFQPVTSLLTWYKCPLLYKIQLYVQGIIFTHLCCVATLGMGDKSAKRLIAQQLPIAKYFISVLDTWASFEYFFIRIKVSIILNSWNHVIFAVKEA